MTILKLPVALPAARLVVALALALGLGGVGALAPVPAQAYSDSERYYDREQIEQLTAPIALYPDPLLAQILAAAAYPGEIAEAHRYMAYRSDFAVIERQDWAPSVKVVARYPEVLDMMARDLDWTEALGIAQINQPDDVADAIQRWRLQAYDLGNLRSGPQQTVTVYGGFVRIVPTRYDYFYIPSYDPRLIYVERYYVGFGPFLLFGTGYLIGSWFDLDWDWKRRRYYYYDRNYWHNRRPVFYPDFDRVHVDHNREWRPDPRRFHPPPTPSFPRKYESRDRVPPPPPDFRPGVRRDSHPPDTDHGVGRPDTRRPELTPDRGRDTTRPPTAPRQQTAPPARRTPPPPQPHTRPEPQRRQVEPPPQPQQPQRRTAPRRDDDDDDELPSGPGTRRR